MASPIHISPAQLSRLIGLPNAPRIIDVRIEEDVASDPQRLPTALHSPFKQVADLVPRLQGAKAVVYCQKGLKLSEGAAAVLRANGVDAEVLTGGHFAWRDAGLPLIAEHALPETSPTGGSVWVTRIRPKIDRVACPWLIRRFVDPDAQFLFVTSSAVEAVADKFNAQPFDIEGVFWSHRAERCTFDTMIEEFNLKTDALQRLARIVRAADTNTLNSEPQASGLLAASLGLSRMYSDDLAQLDAGMLIYDAFYRWCRDATDESHDWPSTTDRR